jgi:hypothetical protein
MRASSFVLRCVPAALALIVAGGTPATAWPPELERALYRDAQKLLPKSLAVLLRDRETQVLLAARDTPPDLTGWASELSTGQIRPETVGAIDAQLQDAAVLMQNRQLSEGLIRLGALFRIAADVSDPVKCVGSETFPPGVIAEYYSFVLKNLDKIPLVLDDPRALKLSREELPPYWQGLLARSRVDAPVIRIELFQNGRLVRHDTLDYRSPVFGVGSLAYSRAVNGVAATWLAGWRSVRGDMGRVREPRLVEPREPPQADRGIGGNGWPQRSNP